MLNNSNVIDRLWPLLMLSKFFGLSSFPVNKRNDGTISYKIKFMTFIWGIFVFIAITTAEPLIKYGFNESFYKFLFLIFYFICHSTESILLNTINQLLKFDTRIEKFKYCNNTENYSSKWLIVLTALRLSFGVFPSSLEKLIIPVFDWENLLEIICRELYMTSFYSIHFTTIFILKDLRERFQALSYEWYSLILDPTECSPSKLENIRILYSELKEITSVVNPVLDKRSLILVALTTLHIFHSAYSWSANYKDSSTTYNYGNELSRTANIVLFVVLLTTSNELIETSMDIVDSLPITSISRLSTESQEQVRFMYECVRMGPLTITVCGFPASSQIWPVVLMEEINIWIAAVQLEQELKRISTRTRIQLLDWVIWQNS